MHPFRLLEGAQITRLGGGTLQIALDPARRVRVADSPQNRELLRRLRAPGEAEIDPINQTLQLLCEQGLASTITAMAITEQRLTDARIYTRGFELSPMTWHSLGLRRVSRLQNATFAILIGKTQTSSQALTSAQIPHVLGDYPEAPRGWGHSSCLALPRVWPASNHRHLTTIRWQPPLPARIHQETTQREVSCRASCYKIS